MNNSEESNQDENKNLSYKELLKEVKTIERTRLDEFIKDAFKVNENSHLQKIENITKILSEKGYAITFIEERIDKYLENQGVKY